MALRSRPCEVVECSWLHEPASGAGQGSSAAAFLDRLDGFGSAQQTSLNLALLQRLDGGGGSYVGLV